MRKVEMSAKGLRVLRDQTKERLAGAANGAHVPMSAEQKDDARVAIREADERLAKAEGEGGE